MARRIYFGMVRDGLPQNQGRIVGIAYNRSILENDFMTTYYVSKLDTDADWSRAVQPGWFVGPGAVFTPSRPATELVLYKQELHLMRDAGEAAQREIVRQAVGHSHDLGVQAHNWIHKAFGGSYLIAPDTSRTLTQRRAWARANTLGPTDIVGTTFAEKIGNYFTHFSGDSPTDWLSFANPNTGARLELLSAFVVAGTISESVDLADRYWIDDITA